MVLHFKKRNQTSSIKVFETSAIKNPTISYSIPKALDIISSSFINTSTPNRGEFFTLGWILKTREFGFRRPKELMNSRSLTLQFLSTQDSVLTRRSLHNLSPLIHGVSAAAVWDRLFDTLGGKKYLICKNSKKLKLHCISESSSIYICMSTEI